MIETGISSGDFLQDVDIDIIIRSGSTDLSELKKFQQAIVASVTSLVDTEIVTTEIVNNVKTTPEKILRTTSVKLRIE